MKGIILNCLLLFITFSSYGQILIGEPESKEKTAEKEKNKSSDTTKNNSLDGSTSVYFVTNWSQTSRLLVSNGEIFGDTLGIRSNETTLNTWSFGIGLQNKLNNYLMWDGGIAFLRNGESYLFNVGDSSYSYETTYSYVGMPIRINYTVGNDFKFYAGAGLVPQMFFGYKQERSWTTKENTPGTETFTTKSGYNSFVVSAVFNIGFVMNLQNKWSLLVSPEARIQLNSSYQNQDGFIHKGRAYGITFGLLRNL